MVDSVLNEWVDASPENKKLYDQEGLILEVTEQIWERMAELGWKKQDLANALGCGKSHITQLLNGGRNMTLRTLSDVAQALRTDVQVRLVETGLDAIPWQDIESLITKPRKSFAIPSVTAANDQWIDIHASI